MNECWFVEKEENGQWKDINGKICGAVLGYDVLKEAEEEVKINQYLYPDTKFRIIKFVRTEK